MRPSYNVKRLVDVGRGLSAARVLAERERWPRERLERYERERVDALVRHAVARSPFYRERFAGLIGPGPVELSALPTLDKATMMERFDDLVTDRRLRRDALLEHLDGLDRDALYLGEHRVMTTSGSSGRKGLFVYDREAWVGILASFFRYSAMADVRPRVPRLRVAVIAGGSHCHMTRRTVATVSIGLHRVLFLPVTLPLPRLVEALNGFRPECLTTYPSMAVLLADEQRTGRLRLSLTGMSTAGELRTPEMTARLEAAFGLTPTDFYGTTEGFWGCTCEHHTGLHLFEDMTVAENVNEDGRPVPAGERGARLLVTNLFNRVQPLIRLEVTDVMTLDSDPCPCGRTLTRARAIDGRSDDVLRLAGVAVHPMQFAVVTADRDVREFQVLQHGDRVRLRVALRDGAPVAETAGRLRERVSERLAALGVPDPHIDVETCAGLQRSPAGKLQTIVADPRQRTGVATG